MPLFKSSKKKAQAQAAEQQGRNEYNQHENRHAAAGTGAGPTTDSTANGYASQLGQGQIRTVNRHGDGGRSARAQAGPQEVHNNAVYDQDSSSTRRHGHGGAVNRTEGRVEERAGELVGSQALQAKGAQKEQEAATIKAQGAELAEAERLEREAVLRRERAVAHGAHPANKHLGAGWSSEATGTTNERY